MKIINAWTRTNLMLRIFIGIIVGTLLATFLPGINAIAMLGDLFVGALKSIAPILVGVLATSMWQNTRK